MIENEKRDLIEQQSNQFNNPSLEDTEIPHSSTLIHEQPKQGFLSKLFGFHHPPSTENSTYETQVDASIPTVREETTQDAFVPSVIEDPNEDTSLFSQESIETDMHEDHSITLARGTFTSIKTTSPDPEEYKTLLRKKTDRRNVLKGIAGLALGANATVVAGKLEGLEALANAPTSEELPSENPSETDQDPEILPQSNEDQQPATSVEDAPQSEDMQPVEQSISVEKREYDRPFENNVGWAYQATDQVSREKIFADMRDMKDRGCNSLYVGHPNPGDSLFFGKTEPGLDFSMYYSIITNEPNTAEQAHLVLQRITYVLDAAKECGMQVVLPVGYKISMGPQWSDENGNQLRKTKDGKNLETWGAERTASPYSEKYWQDIEKYYRWLNDNLISKYDNIKAINIADEPMGGDFSPHAMAEFKRRYGIDYNLASDEQKGEFQLNVIPDYVVKSANLWKSISPDKKTTMTCHIQRESPFSYNIEKIFRETPDTFVFSADTHLYDAPPDNPMTKDAISGLYGMARMLGLYSAAYNKPLMLWQGGNAWSFDRDGKAPELGLNSPQESAALNLKIIHDTVKSSGGEIAMIFGWGHPSVQPRDQVLEGISPQTMYEYVTNELVKVRDTLTQVTDSVPAEINIIERSVINKFAGQTLDGSNHILQSGSIFNLHDIDFINRDLVIIPKGEEDSAARYAIEHGSKDISGNTKDELPLLEKLAGLPGDVKELEPGKVWFGQPPGYLVDEVRKLKQNYEQEGANWIQQVGFFKGCMYFKGPDNNYWPYMVFERGVFHPVADRFELSLTYRDMANGKVELGDGNRIFAEFPEEAKKRLKITPITGESNSQAPSFEAFRKYITVNQDNRDTDMRGQFADIALDKEGNSSLREISYEEKYRYTNYEDETGHNIPKIIMDEITRRFGEKWLPKIGYPISGSYWVESEIGGEMQWVLIQMFERGMLTYHPDYDGNVDPQWVTQGALTGNHFIRLFNEGEDTAYKDSYLHMFD